MVLELIQRSAIFPSPKRVLVKTLSKFPDQTTIRVVLVHIAYDPLYGLIRQRARFQSARETRSRCAVIVGLLSNVCSCPQQEHQPDIYCGDLAPWIMAQTNSVGQGTNGVADESPNMIVYRKVRTLSMHWAVCGLVSCVCVSERERLGESM